MAELNVEKYVEHKTKNGSLVKLRGKENLGVTASVYKIYLPKDVVADVFEGSADLKGAQDFFELALAAIGEKLGKTFDPKDYTLTGMWDREHVEHKKEPRARVAKGDKTSSVEAYVEAIVLALNKKQTEIAANPEMKPVSIKALRGFIKGGYGLSEQTVDTILLNEKIAKHPAIEKIELTL